MARALLDRCSNAFLAPHFTKSARIRRRKPARAGREWMDGSAVVRGQGPGKNTKIEEIDILWMTAGLGCDGDTIAMTGATQPSLEDLVLGGIPGTPKVTLHNPVLAYANGDDFLRPFEVAAEGKFGPFILVVEGSIPD